MTKRIFEAYVKVQYSGRTNMWDSTKVEEFSDGVVDRVDCVDIISNYDKYSKKWPDVIENAKKK